ncbi:hypothetical protein M758_7G122900 [Ceratodon purpureus]|nr:hypothetical protein M758_7G122900 [Ceratodon purpureus]
MKEVFRKSVVGHVFSNKKPLLAFSTVTNQVHKPLMPYLTHLPSFILEALRIWPGRPRETLHSNNAILIELASVHKIWRFLSTLRDDGICAEPLGSCFQRFQ